MYVLSMKMPHIKAFVIQLKHGSLESKSLELLTVNSPALASIFVKRKIANSSMKTHRGIRT